MESDIIIYETDYWSIILISNQAYLGQCVILNKRDCTTLSELTPNEVTDLHKNVIQKLEYAFKKCFNATMFNWTCLMNNAFKSDNPEPQVHWHFRPRYRDDVEFAGELFQDLEFAHHYNKKRVKTVSQDILEKIADKIREFL